AVRDVGVENLALRPHETLRHRVVRDEERARDLTRREPRERAQRECNLRVDRKRWVTAGEHEPQPVVAHATVVRDIHFLSTRRHRDLLELRGAVLRAADAIDRAVAPGRLEPRGGTRRDTVARPSLECLRKRVLRALLREIPVAGAADQLRNDATPLRAESFAQRRFRGRYVSHTGLTSIVPHCVAGISDTTAIASSRSAHSATKKPPICSLVSANGPSAT